MHIKLYCFLFSTITKNNFKMSVEVSGISIGAIEISLYLFVCYLLRRIWYKELSAINLISYCWFVMTVLTFIWELAFISQYKKVHDYAQVLVKNNSHVWTQSYNLTYVNPWKLSTIFYAEYGAHADREYMELNNYWSRLIEGTHAFLCGLFATLALVFKTHKNDNLYLISATLSMGSQLMNSILYMGEYFQQVGDSNSPNYPSASFPLGFALLNRGFMYVNVFWTIMPLFAIITEFIGYHKRFKRDQLIALNIEKRQETFDSTIESLGQASTKLTEFADCLDNKIKNIDYIDYIDYIKQD